VDKKRAYNISYKLRLIAGMSLLFAFIIYSLKTPFTEFRMLFENTFKGNNDYGEFLSKALCLKNALPIDRGVVGYVINKDGPIPRVIGQYAQEIKLYYLTQFAFTPIIIEDNLDHKYVVGNLQDPSSITDVAGAFNFSIEKDCGNGMVVFKRNLP
jgi:hypothetical protein